MSKYWKLTEMAPDTPSAVVLLDLVHSKPVICEAQSIDPPSGGSNILPDDVLSDADAFFLEDANGPRTPAAIVGELDFRQTPRCERDRWINPLTADDIRGMVDQLYANSLGQSVFKARGLEATEPVHRQSYFFERRFRAMTAAAAPA